MALFDQQSKNGFKAFAYSFISVVGTIGGIGYTLAAGQWVIAGCIVGLAAMAAPTVLKAIKEI